MPLTPRIGLPLSDTKLEALLNWLDTDCKAAGKQYTVIQRGLIGLFAAKGFSDAENLADEVIDRVADRLHEIVSDYQGTPFAYFRGVARNVVFEASRRKEIATDTLPERVSTKLDVSDEYNCLLKCLQFLPQPDRDFILDYHVYEGADKIANHESMAQEKNITVNVLRVRAFRLREKLERCVLDCVSHLHRNENH